MDVRVADQSGQGRVPPAGHVPLGGLQQLVGQRLPDRSTDTIPSPHTGVVQRPSQLRYQLGVGHADRDLVDGVATRIAGQGVGDRRCLFRRAAHHLHLGVGQRQFDLFPRRRVDAAEIVETIGQFCRRVHQTDRPIGHLL